MNSPVSKFIIMFLSTILIIILFNRGTVADTVHQTYQLDLSHNHGSSSPLATQVPNVNALTTEAEAASPSTASAQLARFPHLSALCSNTPFTPGLYLHCHGSGGQHKNAMVGGLTNARNRYSACIRLAIDAGANMVIGPLMQRDNQELSNVNWKQVGPETMIDVDDLIGGLGEACPGMVVKACPGGSCDTAEAGETVVRTPDHDHRDGSYETGQFRQMVETVITEKTNGTITRADITPENPLKVEFGDSFMGWNYTATNESHLKTDLYKILHFAPDLLSLGEKVQAAAKKAAEGRDIAGIHFRGEDDWPSDVCNASAQIDFYSKELERWNSFRLSNGKLRDIYLSCGDQGRVQMFRDAMRPLGYVVHDKQSLMNNTAASEDEKTLKEIENLNFDQKAVVEYVSLRDASLFLGLLPSTLSYIVAYERTMDQSFDAPLDAEENAMTTNGKEKEQIGWFEKYILAGSRRGERLAKHWPDAIKMSGDESTKLLVVDGQSELSDAFP